MCKFTQKKRHKQEKQGLFIYTHTKIVYLEHMNLKLHNAKHYNVSN